MTQKPDNPQTKRVTKNDLLLAGWHSIWNGQLGSRWAHPRVLVRGGGDLKFSDAAAILKKRGIDDMGEMK